MLFRSESTKTVVLIDENGIFSIFVDSNQTAGPCTARVVKYIAKSAAKNINSDESQTIVPTATKFGRLTFWVTVVLDMMRIISEKANKLTPLERENQGITLHYW